MSDYDDRSRRRSGRTREPEYVETQETFVHRGSGAANQEMVLRQRDDDYYDDRDRDYADYRRTSVREEYGPRRTRSAGRRSRDFYDDDYHSDHGPSRGRHRSSRYDDSRYDDDYSDRSHRERRKSKVEEVLDDIGLGGVAGAVIGKARSLSRHGRRHSDDWDRDHSRSRSRSRHGYRNSSRDNRKRWQQAAKAAVITGVVEAVRSRNDPGPWTGSKGTRVATAALGAAGIDGFLDKDPDRKSKRHLLESVVGGLAATRLANGPRDKDGDGRGRSRSRSRSVVGRLRSRSASIFRGRSASRGRSSSRGREGGGAVSGLKDLAAAGGVAAIGKAIYDRVRSKSRGRDKRDHSVSSDDSYVPSRRQRYQPDRGVPSDSNNDDGSSGLRGRSEGRDNDLEKSRDRSSSNSTISTTDLEKRHKKTRGKEILTAGLATVATIHALHGVYQSMESSDKRHKMVMEGKMSPEVARKAKSKNLLQDVAAVGIAALGIKSAFGEWKEMNEQRREKHQLEAHKRRKVKQRRKRDREMRMRALTGGGANQYDYQGAAAQYYDSNPYQSYGNLPPPPVGAAPPNRYP